MSTLIPILIIMQFICVCFNYGVVFAYLQRIDLLLADTNKVEHTLLSLLYALPGVLAIPFILMEVNFPNFGFKYYYNEHETMNYNWYVRKIEAQQKAKKVSSQNYYTNQQRAGGRCVDIWK